MDVDSDKLDRMVLNRTTVIFAATWIQRKNLHKTISSEAQFEEEKIIKKNILTQTEFERRKKSMW